MSIPHRQPGQKASVVAVAGTTVLAFVAGISIQSGTTTPSLSHKEVSMDAIWNDPGQSSGMSATEGLLALPGSFWQPEISLLGLRQFIAQGVSIQLSHVNQTNQNLINVSDLLTSEDLVNQAWANTAPPQMPIAEVKQLNR